MYGGKPPLAALLAEGCLRILLEDGAQALAAAGTSHAAFERAVEAMILLSGLGFESGGLSIAHALTRGLPRIAGLATSAHGLRGAGPLGAVGLEARDDGMLAELTRWYAQVGCPSACASWAPQRRRTRSWKPPPP